MSFGPDELETMIRDDDGTPVLIVGRDRSTEDRARLVCMHLGDQSILIGPRYALAVSEALARSALAVLAEGGAMAHAATSTKH